MTVAVKRHLDAVVAGHACVDIVPAFDAGEARKAEEIFRAGKLTDVGAADFCLGGAAPNVGVALAKLGVRVCFVARLGDDLLGRLTRDLLKQTASADGVRVVVGEASSYTIVISPPGIDRIFFHHAGTNDTFRASDVDVELCAQARLFHLGYPPLMRGLYEEGGAELIALYERVKAAGIVTSLDMALPDPNGEAGRVDWAAVLRKTLPNVDLFMPSLEETLFMLDRPKYDRLAAAGGNFVDGVDGADLSKLGARLLEWGAKVAVVKCGRRGFYCRTAERERLAELRPLADALDSWAGREFWQPALAVERIVTATGAGDATIAGLLAAFLRGEPLARAARYAAATGWQSLQGIDGSSAISSWKKTTKLVDDGDAPQLEFKLRSPGWRYCPDARVWRGPRDG